jgi:hypothetical protein
LRKLILILATIIYSTLSFSQIGSQGANRILVQGIVSGAEDLKPIAGVQIFIGKKFDTVSDNEGKFSINANRNDTIRFTFLGFDSKILIVSDTLAGDELIAGIYMGSDTISAGEVIISSRLAGLRSAIMNPPAESDARQINARNNLAISAYQGRVTTGKMGDPATNYEYLRQQQRQDAYEKGQIPSDKIAGVSPFMIIPAMYLLMNGLPEKPGPFKPSLTDHEIDLLHKKYLERQNKVK